MNSGKKIVFGRLITTIKSTPSATTIVSSGADDSAPDRGARSIVTSVSVCLCVHTCVCLCAIDHISGTTCPIFSRFFVNVTYGRGSVVIRRRSEMLRISGFVDDVVFARKLTGCSTSPPG